MQILHLFKIYFWPLRLPVIAGSSPALRVVARVSTALRGAARVSVLTDSKRCLKTTLAAASRQQPLHWPRCGRQGSRTKARLIWRLPFTSHRGAPVAVTDAAPSWSINKVRLKPAALTRSHSLPLVARLRCGFLHRPCFWPGRPGRSEVTAPGSPLPKTEIKGKRQKGAGGNQRGESYGRYGFLPERAVVF